MSRRLLFSAVGGATVAASLTASTAVAAPVDTAAEDTWVAKGELVINAKDYASIQAALDAAVPGAAVLVPPGIYNLTQPLSIPDRVTLFGAGRGSKLRVAGNLGAISRHNAVGVHIRDLEIQNTASTTDLDVGLIDLLGGNDCRVDSCHLVGGRYAVNVRDQARTIISNNTIHGQNGKFATAGIFFSSLTGVLQGCSATGNRIYDVTNGLGIFCDVEWVTGNIDAQIQIIGNHVRNVTDNGIRFQTRSETESTTHVQGGYVIADNIVESAGVNGIRINGYRAVVTGNHVVSPVASGIRDGGGGQNTEWTVVRHSTIANNTVINAGSAGIILQNSSYGNTISGNTIANARSYGIYLGENYGGKIGARDTSILGNIIDGFKNDGIKISGGSTSGVKDIVIADNTVRGTSTERDGISIREVKATDIVVTGNRCRGMQFGIYNVAPYTVIVGNNFRGCTNKPVLGTAGAGNQIGFNVT